MTTGSILRDERFLTWPTMSTVKNGSRHWRIWTGTDRVGEIPQKVTPPLYYETVYNGRKMRFRDYSVDTRPPRRARDEYHPYDVQKHADNTVATWLANVGFGSYEGAYGSWTAPNVSSLGPNDELKLISKIGEKIKGSQFNAAVALGEGREVLGMIAGNAIRIAKSLHHLKRGDVTGSMRSLLEGTDRKPIKAPTRTIKDTSIDNLSSYWLELQYGWLPLLGDVKAGAEFLAHHLSSPLQTTYHASIHASPDPYTWVRPFTGTWVAEDSHTMRIRAVIAENPTLTTKLGLQDPELVAWELLPYSFVADWFLPIGDWLEARASVTSLKGTFYRSEYKRRHITQTSVPVNPNPPYQKYDVVGFPGWSKSSHSKRWQEVSLKVPLPAFKPLNKALSVQHCLNAIALLANFR